MVEFFVSSKGAQSVSYKNHHVIPITTKSFLEPVGRGNQDVGLSCFNLLKGADIEISQFGQFLLGDSTFRADFFQIVAKNAEFRADHACGMICRILT